MKKLLMILLVFGMAFSADEYETPWGTYSQTTQQGFYFVYDFNAWHVGDWVATFNGDVLVGAMELYDEYFEVIGMGFDGDDYSDGYCQSGDLVTFQFYDASDQAFYTMFTHDVCEWQANVFCSGITIGVGELIYQIPDPDPDPSDWIYFSIVKDGDEIFYKTNSAILIN